MSRTLIVVALACVIGMTAWLSTESQRERFPANSPEEVAYKRAHLSRVLDELSARPVDHLDASQREARAEVLAALKDYSDRGRFPINTEKPRYALPYFIDAFGTRCALAYAVDRSGNGDLVRSLAAQDNHAYVTYLTGHEELSSWLADHGLTIEEAAFIQGPGLIDGWGPPPDPGPVWIESEGEEPMSEEPEERGDENPEGSPAAPPTEDSPATGPERGPRSAGFDRGNWSLWWRINRDAFVSLRKRYNQRTTTPRAEVPSASRPSKGEIETKVVPFLMKAARSKGELKATAIVSWALATAGGDSAAAVDATIGYLRKPDSRFRDLLVLALGMARHEKGTNALLEILGDTRDGRAIFGTPKGVSERTRAFAAIALGRTGHVAAIESLIDVLRKEKGDRVDLRTAAITSLGELARAGSEEQREIVARYLLKELKRGKWTDPVLASIPMALVKTGDAEALKEVRRIVARFRGPREVRESCALALGSVDTISERLVEALMASARRDPDLQTRRYAAIALGELCLRADTKQVDAKLQKRIRRFYLGTLEGHFKQPNTLEWHYFSAGLYVRAFPANSEKIVARLERVVQKSKRTSERASAVLALGLSGNEGSLPVLRKQFEASKDVTVRGSCAEALGLLGDRTVREKLLKMALNDASDVIRYQSALGLGYLADRTIVDPMVEELGKTRSAQARAALTRVIGQLGDRRAIDGLIEIAGDEKRKRQTRERAAGALGLIAYGEERGWSFPYRRGFNFHYASPVMLQVLAIF